MFNQRVALNLSATLCIVYNLYKVDYIIILDIKNTPAAIRTRDPLLRRQMLYPAELQTHKLNIQFILIIYHINLFLQAEILLKLERPLEIRILS